MRPGNAARRQPPRASALPIRYITVTASSNVNMMLSRCHPTMATNIGDRLRGITEYITSSK
jgi:hypothetical protein